MIAYVTLALVVLQQLIYTARFWTFKQYGEGLPVQLLDISFWLSPWVCAPLLLLVGVGQLSKLPTVLQRWKAMIFAVLSACLVIAVHVGIAMSH